MKMSALSSTSWRSIPVLALLGLACAAGTAEAVECESSNLGISQCQARCDRGDMVGCVNLAVIHVEGIGTAKNYPEALRLFRVVCEGADGKLRLHACTNLAGMYASGRGTATDYQQSLKLFEIGCAGGVVHACSNLALQYAEGMGVAVDLEKATKLYLQAAGSYQRACDRNGFASCHALAGMYEFGQGVTKDPSLARSLYEKACRGGWKPACEKASSLAAP